MNASSLNSTNSTDPRQDPKVAEVVQRAQTWLETNHPYRADHTKLSIPRSATGVPGEPGEPNLDSQPLPGEREVSLPRAEAEPDPSAPEPSSSAPDQSSPPLQLTHLQSHMVAILKERSTSQSPLDRLPPERQQLILDLLEDYPAEAIASAISLPEQLGGWGISTSRASIHRFRKRVEQNKIRQARANAARDAETFLSENSNSADAFLRAADKHLKLRLYEISQDHDTTPAALGDLCKIVAEIRKLDLAERKLTQQPA